jgi:hypothetical protein
VTQLHAEVRRRLKRELPALETAFAPLLLAAGAPYVDAWDLVPGLAAFLETVAALRIIDELTRARMSDRAALERAAKLLGLDPEALRKRIERLNARTSLSEPAPYASASELTSTA